MVKVMMELGNVTVNDIYEANYHDCPADICDTEDIHLTRISRATRDCDSVIRETWIRTKYVEKAFVMSIEQLKNEPERRPKILRDITFTRNGWHIRNGRRKKIRIRIENADEHSNADNASATDLNNSNVELGFSSENEDSDDNEEENEMKDDEMKEELLENLQGDMLLYKATIVHNLPIMCYALAIGASKMWTNSIDSHRSSIHQAILSVGFLL